MQLVIYNKPKRSYIGRNVLFTRDIQHAQRFTGNVPIEKNEVRVPIKITFRSMGNNSYETCNTKEF
jgi:hypothetical protein